MDYMETASNGEAIQNLLASHDFQVFKTLVLDEISKKAFDLFTTVHADDVAGIVEAQQMKKVVDLIEGTMVSLVEEGRLALDELKNSNPE